MGSEAPAKLPFIKFTQEMLKPGTNSWSLACNAVQIALEEHGCFVATFDKYCSEFHDNKVQHALEEVFDLPTETKIRHTSDKPHFIGYSGGNAWAPIHESISIWDAMSRGIQNFSNLMWPAGDDHNFGETMNSYATLLSNIEQTVSRMVFESYGVMNHYDVHLESTLYKLRLLKYRPPQENESNIGTRAHSDTSFLTVLHQTQGNGLEVKPKDGDEWIPVEFPPSSFIVMAGEGMVAWSNGRVHAPIHQVVIGGIKPRYSEAIFSFRKGIIDIPEELIDEEHPRQYQSFDHVGLTEFYIKNRSASSTKAYCGV